jgi:hypothetical protein
MRGYAARVRGASAGIAPRKAGAAGATARAPSDWQALLLELTGHDVGVCRTCGARAVERQSLPHARAPPEAA